MAEFATLSTTGIQGLTRDMLARAKDAPKEFSRARESIRRAANTETKRQVSAIYNLSQARVQKDLSVSTTAAGVIVRGERRPINFLDFGFRQTRSGVRGKIRRDKPAKTWSKSFIAKGLAGKVASVNKLVFYRTGGTPKRNDLGVNAGKIKEPIDALWSVSVADAMKQERVSIPLRERILGRARKDLSARLARLGGRR